MTIEPDTTAADGDTIAYSEPAHLAVVRAFARIRARALGLSPHRTELLIVAVNELVTNTLQHTVGGGSVRFGTGDGRLTCDVVDGGPVPAFGRAMPPAHAEHGRGLAMVERLCDRVTAFTGPDGTVVRMQFTL